MRYIAVLAVIGVSASIQTARGQETPPFTFTKPDLKLLAECDALDRQFEKRALVYHDAALEQQLAEIAKPLLPAAPMEHVRWRFHLLRDPMVNAFALPNGSVYVNSGLLARAENDDQLVSVLAHEATHVTNRHTYIFNRSLRKKIVAMEVASVVAAWFPVGGVWGAAVEAAASTSQVALVVMVYGYSRQLEEEADRQGLDRLRKAGRNPAEMVRMFAVMDDKLEPEPVPVFFRTHPKIKDRIAYLKRSLGLDQDVPAESDLGYVNRMRPMILQNVQLDLDSRRFRSAVAGAERLVAARADDAVALYWLGESYRMLGPREPRLTAKEQTDDAQRHAYSRSAKRTEEDEAIALAKTPAGAQSLERNRRKAEELFLKAAAADPSLADPQFGLGALYQEEAMPQQAVGAFRRYMELAKQPAEQERAKRRIAEIERTK